MKVPSVFLPMCCPFQRSSVYSGREWINVINSTLSPLPKVWSKHNTALLHLHSVLLQGLCTFFHSKKDKWMCDWWAWVYMSLALVSRESTRMSCGYAPVARPLQAHYKHRFADFFWICSTCLLVVFPVSDPCCVNTDQRRLPQQGHQAR